VANISPLNSHVLVRGLAALASILQWVFMCVKCNEMKSVMESRDTAATEATTPTAATAPAQHAASYVPSAEGGVLTRNAKICIGCFDTAAVVIETIRSGLFRYVAAVRALPQTGSLADIQADIVLLASMLAPVTGILHYTLLIALGNPIDQAAIRAYVMQFKTNYTGCRHALQQCFDRCAGYSRKRIRRRCGRCEPCRTRHADCIHPQEFMAATSSAAGAAGLPVPPFPAWLFLAGDIAARELGDRIANLKDACTQLLQIPEPLLPALSRTTILEHTDFDAIARLEAEWQARIARPGSPTDDVLDELLGDNVDMMVATVLSSGSDSVGSDGSGSDDDDIEDLLADT
jgi:hypothetical protein